MGPIDVIGRGKGGALDEDLAVAVQRALRIPRADAIGRARDFTWEAAADQFSRRLAPIRWRARVVA